MNTLHQHSATTPSVSTPAGCHKRSGAFALRAGRALTLRPRLDSVLRITEGGAWATLPSQPGDHFLRAGDALRVVAGERVVMEPWQVPRTETLYFDWDVAPLRVPAPLRYAARGHGQGAAGRRQRHSARLAQPLRDLRAAAALAAGALARLAGGVFFAATDLIAVCASFFWAGGRFRADFAADAARARSAQSSAMAAQGCMASGDSRASSVAL